MEYLALNNGIQMPLAGFDTFMLNKETCTNAVTATIETGHITFSTLRNILYIIELISWEEYMKKHISAFLLLLAVSVTTIFGCTSTKETTSDSTKSEKTSTEMTPVTLNEVAHSIFYAPMYVAIEKGYFKDEGIALTLQTGFGADKTMTAVISGSADIGFMGSEASIYTYNEGANDYVVNFAQLTQRAGNFLVAREKMDNFKWEDLKGKKVLGGRKGGIHISM